MLALKLVRPRDVAPRAVPHHVHPLQLLKLLDVVQSRRGLEPPAVQRVLGVLEDLPVRLAKRLGVHVRRRRELVPHALKRGLEGALPEARLVVRRRPRQVAVGEVQEGLEVLLEAVVGKPLLRVDGRVGAQIAAVAEQEVDDDLDVEGPVARVVEDEDRVDLEVVEQAVRAVLALVYGRREGARRVLVDRLEEGVEGVDVGFRGEDIGGYDDVLEAVPVRRRVSGMLFLPLSLVSNPSWECL